MACLPSLFGIRNSNRDFSNPNNWGKNQFNSSFPTALTAYMYSKKIDPVYIQLSPSLITTHEKITVPDLFGNHPENENMYYAFERDFAPYQKFVEGALPRVDLVTMNNMKGNCLRGLEIKLTALPDNTTHLLSEDKFASELVVRPDTIVYLGVSIASHYEKEKEYLLEILNPVCCKIKDWASIKDVLPKIPEMIHALDAMLAKNVDVQQPLVIQPIWKTDGKAPVLSEYCLDTFVWSDYAFTRLFVDATKESLSREIITRPARTVIWLLKMLYEYASVGKINSRKIIDEQSYNTKNDKAFALSGLKTYRYMKSKELTAPRIKRDEIKNIILGGGHKLLSPERRFDAVIVNTPGLFE